MRFVKNWSIRNKIRVPLILVGVFLLWMSWSSYQAMTAISAKVHDFRSEFLPSISLVLNADRDLYQSLVAQREMMDRGDNLSASQRDSLNQDRVDNHNQALSRGLEAIERMQKDVDPQLAARFQQLMGAWKAHSDGLVNGTIRTENMDLFEAPRGLLDELGARVDELAATASTEATEVAEGQTLAQLVQLVILVAIFAAAGVLAPFFLVKPIEVLRDRMRDIGQGEGDLTARLTVDSKDELGQVAGAFNLVIEKLQQSITVVKQVNFHLEQSTESLREAAANNIRMADQQHETVDQVVTAVEEMHGAAREIAANSNNGADAATEANNSVERGVRVSRESNTRVAQLSERLNRSSEAVGRLADEAVNIGAVLDVIRGIAEQTNLLALNAAIEAARAGEQGRGFAVVADEVRALASKTQQSTEDIQGRIETLQGGVDEAVDAMKSGIDMLDATVEDVASAAESFETIQGAITRITDMSMQIATATEEQTHVVEEINKNLQLISEFSSEGTEQSRSLSNLAEKLKGHTDELTSVVGSFRV
ncbi:methyl-accepting chemotaxis protein [Saccharospirillum mangrovi]|uniref:methyl-accepting chemotaxis protein n=1 Tax=Saccharospirillum mangrovi TaxID=2161747 RepID=UPI000D3A8246|nr:methyl-accepting chemotaxis protein [Saccharospirillum mangrovi]